MDIISMATASADYATDNGKAPDAGNQDGQLTAGNDFTKALSPLYIKICPIKDLWGHAYSVHTGSAAASINGITSDIVGDDDFVIVSYGRKGVDEGFTYLPDAPGSGLYSLSSTADFEKDLINWNGSWIRAPRIAIE